MMIPSYLPIYKRTGLRITRGESVYLYTDDGQRLLDFASGIAVNGFGHGHPHLVEALSRQATMLWHCSNQFITPQLEEFSHRLTQASGMDSVFFSSAGTEAVEAGIKFMRRYHYERKESYRTRIITFEGGFHGRTYGGISAGGNAYARAGFGQLLAGFDRVAFDDVAAVAAVLSKNTAGILLEPVQGEGGIRAFSTATLQALRALCDEQGILLMCDEVQCGYGRTGALYAYQQAGIAPDIVSSAKALGGGFPLAATLVTERVGKHLPAGCHGSTYGSNPLAMAVGNAALDLLLAEGMFDHITAMGEELMHGLRAIAHRYPQVLREVRGRGLMIGLVPEGDGRELAAKFLTRGLATSPSVSNVIRLLPPYVISTEHVKEALSIIEATIQEEAKS